METAEEEKQIPSGRAGIFGPNKVGIFDRLRSEGHGGGEASLAPPKRRHPSAMLGTRAAALQGRLEAGATKPQDESRRAAEGGSKLPHSKAGWKPAPTSERSVRLSGGGSLSSGRKS